MQEWKIVMGGGRRKQQAVGPENFRLGSKHSSSQGEKEIQSFTEFCLS